MPVTEDQGKTIIDRVERGEKYNDICKDIGVLDHDRDDWKKNHRQDISDAEQYCQAVEENKIDRNSYHWVMVVGPHGHERKIEKNKKSKVKKIKKSKKII